MTPRAHEFLQELEQLRPDENDYLVADLYHLTESLGADANAEELFEAIFQFFESHPGADFGTPGPLVQLIERHAGRYEQLLSHSVSRAPMYTTLHMVNRLLNTAMDAGDREGWLRVLEMVVANPSVSDNTRELAYDFLEFQRSKG